MTKLDIILAFILLFFTPSLVFSQNSKLTVNVKNTTIRETLKLIEAQSSYRFFYNDQLSGLNSLVTIEIEDTSIQNVLGQIFSDQKLTFTMLENNMVVISPVEIALIRSIIGEITDGLGRPLQGVNVICLGTSRGTITDADGRFAIDVIGIEEVLRFSYIGYLSKDVVVDSQSTINIMMFEDQILLDEVIVVGYGAQKKINLTGAISNINSDELTKRPVSNAAVMLQGKMPGLSIIQNSGQPGNERVDIRVRGTGTFSEAGSEPLVIVNGIPGDLGSINPIDISNVIVLKDAASAAIYGSRAANGVILVETKRGTAGKASFNYRGTYGIQYPTKTLDLINNSAEYMELWNEAFVNTGSPTRIDQSTIDAYRNATDREQYPNTDWQDIMIDVAPVVNHHLSSYGGNDGMVYYASVGIADQDGVLMGYNSNKYDLRFNFELEASEWLDFGVNLSGRYKDTSQPGEKDQDTEWSWFQPPMYSPTLPDGSGRYATHAIGGSINAHNPLAFVESNLTYERVYSYQTMGWIEITPVKNLAWQTKIAFDGGYTNTNHFVGKAPLYDFHSHNYLYDLSAKTSLDVGNYHFFSPVLYSTLSYSSTFAEHHNLKILAGYNQESRRDEYNTAYREAFPGNELHQLDAGGADVQFNSGSASEYAIRSVFGRLNYNYKEKYLFESNVRYDVTSRLPAGNRGGLFPSVSAAWRISEEQFMQNVGFISYLKIRASYGTLGNQNIGYYPYQDMITLTGNYPFGNTVSTGAKYTTLSNTNLKWEETTIKDIGIDFGLFEGKISATVDVYDKVTKDILRSQQIPGIVGLEGPTVNSGTVRNTGLELGLMHHGYFGSFKYDIGGNFNTFKNELINFGEAEVLDYLLWKENYPVNSFYMYEWIGIFQDQGEIDSSPEQAFDPQPGDLKFKDQNGDDVVDSEDRIIMDGQYPTFEYAFHLNARWKDFDFTAFFQGVEGKKHFSKLTGFEPFYQGTGCTTKWIDRWTPENHSTTMPRIYIAEAHEYYNQLCSYFLHDASYLRLKNVQIGYTLPRSLTQKIKINSLRIFFSGDNLLTFTDYPGLDPEGSRASWAEQMLGYPQNKVYALGIDLNF